MEASVADRPHCPQHLLPLPSHASRSPPWVLRHPSCRPQPCSSPPRQRGQLPSASCPSCPSRPSPTPPRPPQPASPQQAAVPPCVVAAPRARGPQRRCSSVVRPGARRHPRQPSECGWAVRRRHGRRRHDRRRPGAKGQPLPWPVPRVRDGARGRRLHRHSPPCRRPGPGRGPRHRDASRLRRRGHHGQAPAVPRDHRRHGATRRHPGLRREDAPHGLRREEPDHGASCPLHPS
mmetsp:Transcript_23469/g.52742  ORF Transcript_23469/g.52742 Transcript_23469/m.52742 type:complete len:234 (-) Transcript_23469:2909-3610(-)